MPPGRGYHRHVAATGLRTFLWFDSQALEAAEFYTGLFPDSRLGEVTHYGPGMPMPEGTVLTVEFDILGQPFAALNGGPQFPHSEAVSFQVSCETQDDVDRLWGALTADGGAESRCGWCKDRWGVNWQVVPAALGRALKGLDGHDAGYATRAMMKMSRIVVADLRP